MNFNFLYAQQYINNLKRNIICLNKWIPLDHLLRQIFHFNRMQKTHYYFSIEKMLKFFWLLGFESDRNNFDHIKKKTHRCTSQINTITPTNGCILYNWLNRVSGTNIQFQSMYLEFIYSFELSNILPASTT